MRKLTSARYAIVSLVVVLLYLVGCRLRQRMTVVPAHGASPTSPQAAQPTVVPGGDGTAAEVPGSATLNTGGDAQVDSISCPSSGDCAAVGEYRDGNNQVQAFVVSEVNGRWGTAVQLPGIAALEDGNRFSTANSVSCASRGNCMMGGSYSTAGGHLQAYLASEADGTWSGAVEVPGSGALNAGGTANITAVSCPAPGACTAAGSYRDGSHNVRPLVIDEEDGTLGSATGVPGGSGGILDLSCASVGDCTAVGSYLAGGNALDAFAVSEVNGTWARAGELPGFQSLNSGKLATPVSVSCASAGNCGAGGFYTDRSGRELAFVASEVDGIWRDPEEVPGSVAFGSHTVGVDSVSCPAPGNCAAGGSGSDSSGNTQAFTLSEANGSWGTARAVPVPGAVNSGSASISAISCGSVGNCLAVGTYAEGSLAGQAVLISEVNGAWRQPKEVPGIAKLGARNGSEATTVSCPASGGCGAGGDYGTDGNAPQAFVLNGATGLPG